MAYLDPYARQGACMECSRLLPDAAVITRYQGVEYRFCSNECAFLFDYPDDDA